MRTSLLGTLTTSAIGMGCMGLSQGYGPVDDVESRRAVVAAAEAGVTLFDTAMSYGGGHNEGLVGRALAGRPDLQVATKFGIVRSDAGVRLDAHPSRIRSYCEASLGRLGRDVIDLYYLHRVDPLVPLEEQIGAMADLVADGLVRAIGVSEVTVEQLQTAHRVHPLAAVQLEWSLAWRAPEHDVIPAARALGIGVVAYSPLGRGLLTGVVTSMDPAASSFREGDPRFADEARAANERQSLRLAELAAARGLTGAQLALGWLLAQGDDVVAIPGSRTSTRVVENAAAGDLALDAEVLAELGRIGESIVGDRTSFAAATTRRPA